MVVTQSDSKMEYVEKEVGHMKQDLSKLKGDVDIIKEYMEDLKGWMVRTQDKLEALSTQNKGKHPMVQELLHESVLGEDSGGRSKNGGTESVSAAAFYKERVTTAREVVKTKSGIRKLD